MSDIGAARAIILKAREKLLGRDPEIAEALATAEALMWREAPVRPRAEPSCRPVDVKTAKRIRMMAKRNPKMSLLEIAIQFGTNQGRVSEALHGKR